MVYFPEEVLDIVQLSKERDDGVLQFLAKVHAELLEGGMLAFLVMEFNF